MPFADHGMVLAQGALDSVRLGGEGRAECGAMEKTRQAAGVGAGGRQSGTWKGLGPLRRAWEDEKSRRKDGSF